MELILFCLCIVFRNIASLELPSYIPKCSLSDPKLNDSIVKSANIAIPQLVKGNAEFGIPKLSPLHITSARFEGEDLNILFTDVHTDTLKDIKITAALFDLQQRQAAFSAVISNYQVSSQYSITNSKLLNHSIYGYGDFNTSLVPVRMKYNSPVHLYEKDGETYLQLTNPTLQVDIERAYFQFDNLQSPDYDGDTRTLVDENWKLLLQQLKPIIEEYLLKFVHYILDPFTERLPLNKIFLK